VVLGQFSAQELPVFFAWFVKLALAITALSILMPCSLICAQLASTNIQPTLAQTQLLQGSWEGVLVGEEAAGKCTITITGNSLHFQGLSTNEWYETTFTLPAGTNPQQLHATIKVCPRPEHIGKAVFAIFKIEDGTLTIAGLEGSALDPPKTIDDDQSLFKFEDWNRSKAFEGNHTFRYILKKVQPQKRNTGPSKSK
jgi:hypothetical protein